MPNSSLAAFEEAPRLPAGFFFSAFRREGKVLFLLLYSLLAIVLAALLYFVSHPTQAVLSIQASSISSFSIETIATVHQGYRHIPMLAPVYSGFSYFTATPIQVNLWLVCALGLFQAAGFAALLAASARIDGVWGYLIYFLVSAALYASQLAYLFVRTDPFRLAALGLILVFLVPAYLFKTRVLSWSLTRQFLLFFGLLLLLYTFAWVRKGEVGLHRSITYSYPVLAVVTLFVIALSGRDLINLVFLLGNNAAQPTGRQPYGRLVGIAGLLIVLQVILLILSYRSVEPLAFRPIYLFAIAVLAMPFTQQNVYPQLRSFITANLAFVLVLLGSSLLAAGFLFYFIASAEFTLTLGLERVIIVVYTLIGALYLVYILGHFTPWLRSRKAVYYVLMEPPVATRVRFISIWFITAFFVLLLEGSRGWPTREILNGAYYSNLADNAVLDNNPEYAQRFYKAAIFFAPSDPKSNYNLAALTLADDAGTAQAEGYYRLAEAAFYFPPARLNHSNLLLSGHKTEAAKNVLLAAPQQPTAQVYNNLALVYRQLGQADSTNFYFKLATARQQDVPELYANELALQLAANQLKQAREVAQTALQATRPNAALLEELAYLSIRDTTAKKAFAFPAADTSMPASTLSNLALAAYTGHQVKLADSLANLLKTKEQTPANLLVKLITQLGVDSLPLAYSRYEYLARNYPLQAALAAHIMGVYHFSHNVPEMAAEDFRRAAISGYRDDSLHYACMLADAGNQALAIKVLTAYTMARKPEATKTARHELALLLKADRKDEVAGKYWAFADLTLEEGLRLGRYLAANGNMALATEQFALLAAKDTVTVLPFLELGTALMETGDDIAALQNFRNGLARQPQNIPLRLACAEALIRKGQLTQAVPLIHALAHEQTVAPTDVALLEARLAMRKEQWPEAARGLRAILLQRPLDRKILSLLATTYYTTDDVESGILLFGNAVRLDSTNGQLWRYYAHFAAKANQVADAHFAAHEALKYTYLEADRKELAQELAGF